MQKPLHVLETAFWTALALIMLLLFFALLVGFAFDLLPLHLGLAAGQRWWVVGGVSGGVLLGLGLLWWWWGRVLKDRETARRFIESGPDK